jgi:hypothetical protein
MLVALVKWLLFEKYIFFFLCKLYIQSPTGSIFSLFFINWIHKGLVMVASQPLLLSISKSLAYRFDILKFLAKWEKYFSNNLVSGFDILGKLANLGRLRAGHRPRIVVSSCLVGLFVRLTGLFVRLVGLFVSLAGFWVFWNKICQTVGNEIFFSSPYYFGSWQTTRFGKQNLSNCWR